MNTEKTNTEKITAFVVYEKETKRKLATLPLTVPIGATLESFESAGFVVGWTWGTIKK
jgi:hypothetical protein